MPVEINRTKINEQPMLNGRVVHARPSSVPKHVAKKTISKEELDKANNIQSTTLLDEEEQRVDASKDKRSVNVIKKESIYTPDTTVLGFEDFDEPDDEKKDVTVDGRIPVKKPSTPKHKQAVIKPKKIVKEVSKKLKVVSRENLKSSKKGDDLATTVISEPDDTQPVIKPVEEIVKTKVVDQEVKKDKVKPKKLKVSLTRLSNQENVLITKDKFVIGKSKYSDYQVKGNNTVSRSHICFSFDGNKVFIEDTGSKNGTFVDGVSLKPHDKTEITDGQTIRLSDEVFRVKIKD